jgi:hypothetical protein
MFIFVLEPIKGWYMAAIRSFDEIHIGISTTSAAMNPITVFSTAKHFLLSLSKSNLAGHNRKRKP